MRRLRRGKINEAFTVHVRGKDDCQLASHLPVAKMRHSVGVRTPSSWRRCRMYTIGKASLRCELLVLGSQITDAKRIYQG